MYYKLSDYAKKRGICYRTAWNRYKLGKIEGAFLDETKHVCVPVRTIEQTKEKKVVLYARVSSNEMKENLERQLERLTEFSIKNGYIITNSFKEIASGMNDNRNKLNKLLITEGWDYLVVENKDRLTRFGFNYIKILLEKQGKEIIVINNTENDKTDLIQDLVSIIYSFSARLYGLRKKKNKEDIIKFLEN